MQVGRDLKKYGSVHNGTILTFLKILEANKDHLVVDLNSKVIWLNTL